MQSSPVVAPIVSLSGVEAKKSILSVQWHCW